MSNPYSAAIEELQARIALALRWSLDPNSYETQTMVKSCGAAINLLTEAGKVDKAKAQDRVKTHGIGCIDFDEEGNIRCECSSDPVWNSIRSLLEALPEPEKGPK